MRRKEPQWEEWLKPRTYPLKITKGVDFVIEPKALVVLLQDYVRRQGLGSRFNISCDDTTVTIGRV